MPAPSASAQSARSFDAVAPAMRVFVDKGEAAGVVTLLATRDDVLHLDATGSSESGAGAASCEPTTSSGSRR